MFPAHMCQEPEETGWSQALQHPDEETNIIWILPNLIT